MPIVRSSSRLRSLPLVLAMALTAALPGRSLASVAAGTGPKADDSEATRQVIEHLASTGRRPR